MKKNLMKKIFLLASLFMLSVSSYAQKMQLAKVSGITISYELVKGKTIDTYNPQDMVDVKGVLKPKSGAAKVKKQEWIYTFFVSNENDYAIEFINNPEVHRPNTISNRLSLGYTDKLLVAPKGDKQFQYKIITSTGKEPGQLQRIAYEMKYNRTTKTETSNKGYYCCYYMQIDEAYNPKGWKGGSY